MRATLETTQNINKISTALLASNLAISAIECTSIGFYVIWHYGSSIRETNDIHKALRTIDGLGICKGEDGFLASKGAFITVAL